MSRERATPAAVVRGRLTKLIAQLFDEDFMPPIRPPLRQTTRELTDAQHRVVQIMRTYQFGRVENMPVRGGQPILDENVRVVRTKHLGGNSAVSVPGGTGGFELKKAVRDLFEELERLQNGTVTKLEFRHGLPVLLETTAGTTHLPPS